MTKAKESKYFVDLINDRDLWCVADEMTMFGETRLQIYLCAREHGSPHEFAAMVALQRAPRVMTDDVFYGGMGTLAKQYEGQDSYLNAITSKAQSLGHKPNVNDVYIAGLAKFPGDPEAFVPASGGRGYVKSLCERRGWGCEGAVEVSSRAGQEAPPKPIKLGEDLIQKNVKSLVAANPDKARKPARELREEVISKHGAK